MASAKTKEVAVAAPPGGMSPAVAERMKAAQGRGTSTLQADNIVPMLYILQGLSPQIDKKKPAYIPGAEAGMIWLRNQVPPIVPGEEGILFQPAWFTKDIVEWIPRKEGGGFVTRHEFLPGETFDQACARLGAKPVEDADKPGRPKWKLPNGHELVETRYHMGHVFVGEKRIPFVIPLKSTGHSFSKNWMFSMNSLAYNGIKPDTWFAIWRLTTSQRKNAAGEWYMFDAAFEKWVDSVEDLDRGESLYNAFLSGEKTAEAEADVDGAEDRAAAAAEAGL